MEIENLEPRDMEQGMTYVRVESSSKKFIFTYSRESSTRNNVIYGNLLRTDDTVFEKEEGEITVIGHQVRKAMVNEEVWIEECAKAGKWMKEDQAMAEFMKRFEKSEEPDKKKIRVGYIDKEGKSKSKVVVADTLEDAMTEIPDLESVTYSVDA